MSLRYYMDQHVDERITNGLRRRGIDVLTAHEDDNSAAPDEFLLARATELGRVIFSQDKDFLRIGSQWQQNDQAFAGIIYSHQLQITVGQAVRDLEFMSQVLEAEEMLNKVEFIPL